MIHVCDGTNAIQFSASDIGALKNQGFVLITLVEPEDEIMGDWSIITPNKEHVKAMIVDLFGSIAKFQLDRR
jgi:hypothetical protein